MSEQKDSIKRPRNEQPLLWQRTLHGKQNALLVEKIETIRAKFSSGEQFIIKQMLKEWARIVGLKCHFPNVTDADYLRGEMVYYLDYCEKVKTPSYSHARSFTVMIANHIINRDAYHLCVCFSRWQAWLKELHESNRTKALARTQTSSNMLPASNREPELSELQEQLNHLNKYGDITDSTQRFELEKKIHELTHKLGDDEWPDVIGGER